MPRLLLKLKLSVKFQVVIKPGDDRMKGRQETKLFGLLCLCLTVGNSIQLPVRASLPYYNSYTITNSISGMTEAQTIPQPQQELEKLKLEQEIRDRVQSEVDSAFRNTTSLLNAFLIALTLLPVGAAVAVWLLMAKLAKQTYLAEQEIDSLKIDAVTQLKVILTEAQGILTELKENNKEIATAQKPEAILLEETKIQEPSLKLETAQSKSSAIELAKQGDNFAFEGRYMEAINAYNQALELQPYLADTWNNRGVVLTRLQRYQEALGSYEQATQIRADYGDAWNNRGVVLLELHEYEEALNCYEQAIKVKPDYADAWNNRGVVLAKLQKYREAINSYNQALAINNEHADAWNNRGVSLAKLQNYSEALYSYDNSARIRPDHYRVWYNKARCYALQSNIEATIENLVKAIGLNALQTKELAKVEPDFDLIRDQELFINTLSA